MTPNSPLFVGGQSVFHLTTLFAQKRPTSIVIGVSGTDSAVASLMCHRAIQIARIDCRLHLVHFGAPYPPEGRSEEGVARILQTSPSYRWVPRVLMPWLAERLPEAVVETRAAPAPEDDYSRWSELFRISKLNDGWVAAPINATEDYLGNYSNFAKAASIWPIANLSKSDVLDICHATGVPLIAIENARQADCDCGRDDLAAAHIVDIDLIIGYARDILRSGDLRAVIDAKVLPSLARYVRDCLADQGFKAETPYVPGHRPHDRNSYARQEALDRLETLCQ
jgi:NH3-dependent NAD+ synthetase